MLRGVCWTPNIGEGPESSSGENGCSPWLILEDNAPLKYSISPGICTSILKLAATLGCPPPPEIEYLLLQQGGRYPTSVHLIATPCEHGQSDTTGPGFSEVLDGQMALFQRF